MWTPRCSLVGVTLVWEEMDICNSQVSLLFVGGTTLCICIYIYFQVILSKDFHVFFSFFFQLLSIVQPHEHVALIYHCHASQCVLVNFWKAHAHTSLLTRLVATFLTTNTKVTSKLSQKEETLINLYMTIV